MQLYPTTKSFGYSARSLPLHLMARLFVQHGIRPQQGCSAWTQSHDAFLFSAQFRKSMKTGCILWLRFAKSKELDCRSPSSSPGLG